MRVLVTGDAGHVGEPLARTLAGIGHEVVGFDRSRGQQILEPAQVAAAAEGCDAVVHAAALAHDTAGTPAEILAVNVTGTWNVLRAAEAAGAAVAVCFSSAQAFGFAEGEQPPAYLPVDDAHPRRATRAYGLSKCFGEDLCAAATRRSGLATVVLRPVAVWAARHYEQVWRSRREDPASEWSPFWELGAFVDVEDVADAAAAAVSARPAGHHRLTLCAADISASRPALEMADRLLAGVPWRPGRREAYEQDPWRSLVDTSAAEAAIGWRPARTWRRWVEASGAGRAGGTVAG